MPQLPFLVVHGALVSKLLFVGLVAVTGLVAVRRLDLRRGLLIAAVSVAVWCGVLYAIGPHVEPDAAEQNDQLAPPRPPCPALGMPLELGLDETLAAARACGNRKKVIEALVMLGRYDEAAPLVDPTADDPALATVAYLGAGRWRDAASAVRRHARASSGEDAIEMGCFGDYLDVRAGDEAALARLASIDVEACQLMKSVASGEAPRAGAIFYQPAFDLSRLLAASVRDRRLFVEPAEPLVATWLGALAPPTSDPIRSEYLANLRATRDIVLGDFAGAAMELREAPGSDDRERLAARRELRVDLALRTGAPLPAPIADAKPYNGESIRAGHATQPAAGLETYDASCDLTTPVQQAIAGDGASLGRALQNCTLDWRTVTPVMPAILSRVTIHRAELAVGLRHVRNWETHATRPFQLLSDAALYRDMARLIGDDADAARWQARISRHAAMLVDRDRVIAFAIWHSLSPDLIGPRFNAARGREPEHEPPPAR